MDLEKINKIGKLKGEKRKLTQINKSRDERRGFTAEHKGLLETRIKNDLSRKWKDERRKRHISYVCKLSELNLRA